MTTIEQMAQTWKDLRGRVQSRWPKLTEDDLYDFGGGVAELAGVLADRYGITSEQASHDLDSFATELGTSLKEVASRLDDGATSAWRTGQDVAADVVARGAEGVKDAWAAGKHKVTDLCTRVGGVVRARPLAAIGVALGAGALVALLLRRRKS